MCSPVKGLGPTDAQPIRPSTSDLDFLRCHGPNPKHPKETGAMDTPIKRSAKPYCPAPTAHHVYAAASSCCQARNSTSTTTTGTAPNFEASPIVIAISEQQPAKPEPSRSRRRWRRQGPANQYTAGKTRFLGFRNSITREGSISPSERGSRVLTIPRFRPYKAEPAGAGGQPHRASPA